LTECKLIREKKKGKKLGTRFGTGGRGGGANWQWGDLIQGYWRMFRLGDAWDLVLRIRKNMIWKSSK